MRLSRTTAIITLIILAATHTPAAAQLWPDSAVATALAYIRLTPDDLTLRSDYVPRDSCRMPQVDALMDNPRISPGYLRNAAHTVFGNFADAHASDSSRTIADWPDLSGMLTGINLTAPIVLEMEQSMPVLGNIPRTNPPWGYALGNILEILSETDCIDSVLGDLPPDDYRFVLDHAEDFVIEDEADKNKSAETLDSLQKIEDQYAVRFAALAPRIHWDYVCRHGSSLMEVLFANLPSAPPEELLQRTAEQGPIIDELTIASVPPYECTVIFGTPGPDEFTGNAILIIDPGGDDHYALDPLEPGRNRLIIDYGGNDSYDAPAGYDLGSARYGWSILIDQCGNDVYNAGSFSLGAGWFGIGALLDFQGRDTYIGDIFTQGAGAFGIGILYDGGAESDQYTGRLFAQGFGFAAGLGVVADEGGNDLYMAGGKYEDVLRYRDHFLSLSQGFGYGIRPHFSGGIGLMLDQNGNDVYIADIFGQACSYWWAFGGIYDGAGNDHYIAYQYAQGSATHLTAGCLLDMDGDDRYESKGVSQGCGHDWATGMLLDLSGNDRYTATDLSQAAGSANGIGTLIDCAGDDGYYVVSSRNTQGYGNPRREYGSIGLFLDLGGADRYDGPGSDSAIWIINSKWGIGADIDADSTTNKP
jgi:hypothetical protein